MSSGYILLFHNFEILITMLNVIEAKKTFITWQSFNYFHNIWRMIMRYLCIVNTYYQLLFCIQLRLTLLKMDYMTVLVSDHSKKCEPVVSKINKLHLFDEIYFIKTLEIDQGIGIIQKQIDCIKIGLNMKTRYDHLYTDILNKNYDYILFNNMGYLFIDAAYSYFYRYNKKLKLALFEEGILSYSVSKSNLHRRKLINLIKIIRRKKTFEELICLFYCYYSRLYQGNLNTVEVPIIKKQSKICRVLRYVFDIDLEYPQKYIFFASVYDFEGGKPVGEFELVNKIADLVGKENLLIKIHPRDTRTIYQDNGFNVDKNSAIPWEAIQLSGDFRDKVFMTINSGAVLAGSIMSENPVKTYYMYKLCDISGNRSCQKNARDIEQLLDSKSMRDVLWTVHIAERLDDIL